MEIIKYLSESSIVSDFKILEYKTFPNGFYIKISARLKDSSTLNIIIYIRVSDGTLVPFRLNDL